MDARGVVCERRGRSIDRSMHSRHDTTPSTFAEADEHENRWTQDAGHKCGCALRMDGWMDACVVLVDVVMPGSSS